MHKHFAHLLVALASTAAAAGAFGTGCMTSCTELGCPTGVAFRIDAATDAFAAEMPVTLRLCAGTDCRELTLSQDAQGNPSCVGDTSGDPCDVTAQGDLSMFVDASVEDPATATIEVTNAQGDTLYSDSIEVPIEPIYPNGEACGAACHSGQAVFTPTPP